MLRRTLFCAFASVALLPVAVSAHPGGGGGGMGGPGNAGGFGMGGPAGMGNGGTGGMNDAGSSMRDPARANSQGPAHASATGIAHANQNSVLAGTTSTRTATSGPLAGLSTGTTLYSNGTAVGTVAQIRLNGQGAVTVVVVKGTNGGFYAVPANKLAFSGGTLSTTARLAGINGANDTTETADASTTTAAAHGRVNSQGPAHASAIGIAHANKHSVLSSASASR